MSTTESAERGEVVGEAAESAEELVARRLWGLKTADGETLDADDHANNILDDLYDAGRLFPPVVQTREEWGVRVIDAAEPPAADLGWPIEPRRTEATAREYLAYLARVDGTRTTYGVRGELVVRTISTLADDGSPYGGATLTGRWREVNES